MGDVDSPLASARLVCLDVSKGGQPCRRVRCAIEVCRFGPLEPLPGLSSSTSCEQQVSVRVPDSRNPRCSALAVQPRSVERPERRLDVAEVSTRAGGNDHHLRLSGLVEPAHGRVLGHGDGSLGPPEGALTVGHHRQIDLFPTDAACGLQLLQSLAEPS